ncbi:hypothetical protein BJY22_000339 [Kribbella shirazensis]|uniref:Uncharacterized protein n=1 Tax=Kribbella shirazensis TaxID=1105143 RepID=A0A7X5V604_9ACTN|nr:hypothetical protein [Kribbella shirazensis]
MSDETYADTGRQCPSSGETLGVMIEIPGSDDWKIK